MVSPSDLMTAAKEGEEKQSWGGESINYAQIPPGIKAPSKASDPEEVT